MRSHRLRDLFVILTSVSLLCAVGCSSSEDDTTGTDGTAPGDSAASSTGEPELTVTAADLVKAFNEDSTAATDKYDDKLLKVTGVVGTNLNSESGGEKYIEFGEPLEDHEFQAILKVYLSPDEVSKADELWRGQEVTIVGKCVAPGLSDLLLKDGRIDSVGDPIPVIEIAAGDLIGEFQADADATNKKYRYKILVISGVVAAKDDTAQNVEIRGDEEKGDNPIRLETKYYYVDKDLKAALEKYKPGDAIKLKAECGRTSVDGSRVSLYYAKILNP